MLLPGKFWESKKNKMPDSKTRCQTWKVTHGGILKHIRSPNLSYCSRNSQYQPKTAIFIYIFWLGNFIIHTTNHDWWCWKLLTGPEELVMSHSISGYPLDQPRPKARMKMIQTIHPGNPGVIQLSPVHSPCSTMLYSRLVNNYLYIQGPG